ncbi:hypothetical protein N665_0174s0025 [Sinapis alba]|nr:hypothetical protein N665_0174s0025 [Sinapis alba]
MSPWDSIFLVHIYKWNLEETKILIELLVEGIKREWYDSSGLINKATIDNKILPVLNERVGCQKFHKHYQSRIKILKNLYQDLKIIFDGTTANGGNSLGLNDTTNARTNLVGDNQVKENLIFCKTVILEKLIPRKRARTEACYNFNELKNDNNYSIVTVSNKILKIINLDQRTKFKAVTLIYSLGMKDVFADISIEKHFGWIPTNIS